MHAALEPRPRPGQARQERTPRSADAPPRSKARYAPTRAGVESHRARRNRTLRVPAREGWARLQAARPRAPRRRAHRATPERPPPPRDSRDTASEPRLVRRSRGHGQPRPGACPVRGSLRWAPELARRAPPGLFPRPRCVPPPAPSSADSRRLEGSVLARGWLGPSRLGEGAGSPPARAAEARVLSAHRDAT